MKLLFYILLSMTLSVLQAQQITSNQAVALAEGFFSARTGKAVSMMKIEEKSNPQYHVVVDELNTAFVIVSATRKAFPIIAWSDESGFADPMPEPVQAYFNWVSEQLIDADKMRTVNSEVENAWLSLEATGDLPDNNRSAISPLLSSTWDQGCYYNGLCPPATGGPCEKCYAGCVATAMGQVMYYHQYPAQGQGSHIYGTGTYSNLSADFGATTYDWASMPASIDADHYEIARLLYHCGVSVNMGYAPDGSGASTIDSRDAFVNYFRYADYAFHSEKSMFPDQEWYNLIENELLSRRPIMYRGFGSGGHAFVLDGMDNSNHFHFNWGWSGYYNGYFYLSNLNPGGADFTSDQAGIFAVEPGEDDVMYCASSAAFSALTDTISDGSGAARYANSSNCSWLIQPAGAQLITITFSEFATEKDIDVVYIYNGTSSQDPLVAAISGFSLPQPVLVWGPSAYIVFQTDAMMRADGFTLSYQTSMVGLEEAWNADKINVFPNPADEELNITIDDCIGDVVENIELYNAAGQFIETATYDHQTISFTISTLPAGLYSLKIIGKSGQIVKSVAIH